MRSQCHQLSPRVGLLLSISLASLVSGCATPIYKNVSSITTPPRDVAAAPERYANADVIWGGKILAVRNRPESTDIEIVAFPLDRGQRPDRSAPSEGRFVVVLPGYVEANDYPASRYLTVHGHVTGSRVATIDERNVVFPLVRADDLHLWPANFPGDRPQFHFGVGVGVRIH
ncbi:MAG: Slp/YeaY family lipoprotein [Dokdonella sp.]